MSKHALATTFGDLTRVLQSFNVVTSRYRGDGDPLHIVSVNGEYFKADNHDIKSLRNGMTPDDLQLCPCGDSFEEDE